MRWAFPGGPHRRSCHGWQGVFTAFERQDALWFLRIATTGYAAGDGSAAFFPLYPLVVRAVSWIVGGHPLFAAMLVSNLAFFGSLVVLYDLTVREFSEGGRAEDDRLPRDLPDGVLLPRSVQRIALPPALAHRVPRGEAGSVGQRGGGRRARGAHPQHRRGPGSGAHRDGARATERPQQPVAAGARRRGGAPRPAHLPRVVGAGTRNRAGADPCTGQLATPCGLSAHDALERRQARGGPRGGGSELLADRRSWSSAW